METTTETGTLCADCRIQKTLRYQAIKFDLVLDDRFNLHDLAETVHTLDVAPIHSPIDTIYLDFAVLDLDSLALVCF